MRPSVMIGVHAHAEPVRLVETSPPRWGILRRPRPHRRRRPRLRRRARRPAYTSGSHIVIGDGGADTHTLAHELTHVTQQRHGPVPGTSHRSGFDVSDPFDAYEKAAEANAAQITRTPLNQHHLIAAGTSHQHTPAAHPPHPRHG